MSEEQDPLLGRTILDYEILSLIGRGGVGRVYLAKHPFIGKEIAVKVLKPEYSRNKMVMARFFREAQTVNEIRHENVIDIFNLHITPEEDCFILMEYLEGRPLSAAIR